MANFEADYDDEGGAGPSTGCPRILENSFKTFLRPILDQILGNLRPISNGPI